MGYDLASVDHILTTTRSVRKRLDFDRPVPPELIEECIDIALQAPTGSNAQGWHWVVVTDPAKKKAIGDFYNTSFTNAYLNAPPERQPQYEAGDPRGERRELLLDSATYLARRMGDAPVLVIPCIEGRVENAGPLAQASIYGSILPGAWSFMLAARARGLGSAWTTLHLIYEKETAEILDLPKHITQAALLPVGYFKGESFRPAPRLPAGPITHWDSWGSHRS